MSVTNDWAAMSVPAKWKHVRAGMEVPISLAELDRLEKLFGGEPNEDNPEATTFWGRATVRPRGGGLLTHTLFLKPEAECTRASKD